MSGWRATRVPAETGGGREAGSVVERGGGGYGRRMRCAPRLRDKREQPLAGTGAGSPMVSTESRRGAQSVRKGPPARPASLHLAAAVRARLWRDPPLGTALSAPPEKSPARVTRAPGCAARHNARVAGARARPSCAAGTKEAFGVGGGRGEGEAAPGHRSTAEGNRAGARWVARRPAQPDMHPAHRVATRRRGAAQPLRLMRRAGVAVALVLALVTVPARASIAARGKHAPQPASKDSAPNAPSDARELGSLQRCGPSASERASERPSVRASRPRLAGRPDHFALPPSLSCSLLPPPHTRNPFLARSLVPSLCSARRAW